MCFFEYLETICLTSRSIQDCHSLFFRALLEFVQICDVFRVGNAIVIGIDASTFGEQLSTNTGKHFQELTFEVANVFEQLTGNDSF